MKRTIIFSAIFMISLAVTGCRKTGDAAVPLETVLESESQVPGLTEESGSGTCHLIDYKTRRISLPGPQPVTEKDIDQRLEELCLSEAARVSDRGIQEGDIVTISYTGKIGNVPYGGGAVSETVFEYGNAEYSIEEEITECIKGAKIGEQRTCFITYGEDTGIEGLNGNTMEYTVIVKDIRACPKPDDAFAAEHSDKGASSLKDYREELRKELESERDNQSRNAAAGILLETILKESEIIPSQSFYSQCSEDYDKFFKKWLEENGMTVESYMKEYGADAESMKKAKAEEVMDTAKIILVAEKMEEDGLIQIGSEAVVSYWKNVYKSEISKAEADSLYEGMELKKTQAMAAVMNYLTGIVNVTYNSEESQSLASSAE